MGNRHLVEALLSNLRGCTQKGGRLVILCSVGLVTKSVRFFPYGGSSGALLSSTSFQRNKVEDNCFPLHSFVRLCCDSCHIIMHLKKIIKTGDFLPQLVRLSGLSTSLRTEGLPVRFPVRAHAWV